MDIPNDLDKAIWETDNPSSAALLSGFIRNPLPSHMLLSASDSSGMAMEQNGRGLFTTTLLETLIATGAEKVTYADVFLKIPSLPQ